MKGKLFVVATPIGNLHDITFRAVDTLKTVDWIACEDTRHSKILLDHFLINKKLISYHEHNEVSQSKILIESILNGLNGAIITDAGTPLISDPGSILVNVAISHNIEVVPIPGACALIAALSAAGVDTTSFIFYGFLPTKTVAKRKMIEDLKDNEHTMVFYEAPHRLIETIKTMLEIFPADREIVMARELTKTFETIKKLPLQKMLEFISEDTNQTRGEIVLILNSLKTAKSLIDDKILKFLDSLLVELPLKTAVRIASDFSGISKNILYDIALNKNKNIANNFTEKP